MDTRRLRASQAGELLEVGRELRLVLRSSDLRYESGLLHLLPSVEEMARADLLEIDLSDTPSFYPSSVAPLCTWFLAHKTAMSHLHVQIVRPNDNGAAEWLDKVGFFDTLINGSISSRADNVTVALHAINPDERTSTDQAIEHISNLVRRHAQGFSSDVLHSTQTAIAEVIENVVKHSQLTTPGFVCGQFHRSNHRFALCVADAGIGLRESFRSGPYIPARERLESGDNPLEMAVEPLMSSKYGMGHSGYGLFYASELCALANGQFIISSDNDTLAINGRARQHTAHGEWRGTVVNILLDTTAPVRSEEIWKKFPSEDEDDDWITSYISSPSPPFIAMWHFGTRLYTRDSAKEILLAIKERVLQGTPLSFENVTTVTPSFADEFFRVLFEEIGEERYRSSVKVAAASHYIRRLIELVLKNRPSVRGEGGLVWK